MATTIQVGQVDYDRWRRARGIAEAIRELPLDEAANKLFYEIPEHAGTVGGWEYVVQPLVAGVSDADIEAFVKERQDVGLVFVVVEELDGELNFVFRRRKSR